MCRTSRRRTPASKDDSSYLTPYYEVCKPISTPSYVVIVAVRIITMAVYSSAYVFSHTASRQHVHMGHPAQLMSAGKNA